MTKIVKMYREGNAIYCDCLMADGVVHEKRVTMPFQPNDDNDTFVWTGTYEFLEDFCALVNRSI